MAVRILLLGNTGQLGRELERALAPVGRITALDYPDVDLRDEAGLRRVVRDGPEAATGGGTDGGAEANFQIIVNAAAYTAVDSAEDEAEAAMAINGGAPGVLAEEAARSGAALVHFSTDYVFDGAKGSPYVETDAPRPLGVYGKSKLAGEEAVARVGGAYVILRTAWVYTLRRESYVTKVMRWADEAAKGAARGATLAIVDDQVSNPTWARELAEATARLLSSAAGGEIAAVADTPTDPDTGTGTHPDTGTEAGKNKRKHGDDSRGKGAPGRVGEASATGRNSVNWIRTRAGLYHLAGDGFASRFEWAQEILRLRDEVRSRRPEPGGANGGGKGVVELVRAKSGDFRTAAERPFFSALDCAKFESTFGFRLPPWRESLRRAFE